MNKYIILFLSACVFSIIAGTLNAQQFSVEVFITNQPDNYILFGSVMGDDFTPIDSTFIYPESRKVIFHFPENSPPGVYRIVLGKTPYARMMGEAPQQFDFIFNNENMVFKTDFKEPVKKLEVVKSVENDVWYEFRAKDKILQDELTGLKKEIAYYLSINDTLKMDKKATDYNTLQMARDLFIKELAKRNSELLVSNIIINQRSPLLDGYLSDKERDEVYKKEFFKVLDFTDERLIRSSVYTDKVFEYLVNYNDPYYTTEEREKEYIKAVDIVLPGVNKNESAIAVVR